MPQAARRASASPAPGNQGRDAYPLRSKSSPNHDDQRTPEHSTAPNVLCDPPPAPKARQLPLRTTRSSSAAAAATAAPRATTDAPSMRLTKAALAARLQPEQQQQARVAASPQQQPPAATHDSSDTTTSMESGDFQPLDPDRMERRRAAAAGPAAKAPRKAKAASGAKSNKQRQQQQAVQSDSGSDDEYDPQGDASGADVMEISSDASDGIVSEGDEGIITISSDTEDEGAAPQQAAAAAAAAEVAAVVAAGRGAASASRGRGGAAAGRGSGRGSRAAIGANAPAEAQGKGKAAASAAAAAAPGDEPPPPKRARGGRGRGRGAAAAAAGGAAAGRRRGGARTGDAEDDGDVWGPYGEEELEAIDLDAVYGAHDMREPPAEVLMPLLPFQKQFLAWAIKQEQGTIKGGILADEMGMGKTIQAISVIVTHRTDDFAAFDAAAAAAAAAAKAGPAKASAADKPKLRIALKPRGDAGAAGTLAGAGQGAEATGAGAGAACNDVRVTAEPKATCADEPAVATDEPASAAHACGGQCSGEQQQAGQQEAAAPFSGAGCSGRGAEHQHGVGCDQQAHDHAHMDGETEGPFCKATLVICPVVAIIQWRQEIARFTTPGALKVVVYHGAKRAADPAELASADVVLTTYSTIENEYRRTMMHPKVACQYCQKKFYPERLKVHLRFFCGPNAMKSEALAKAQKKKPRKGGSSQKLAEGEEEEEEELELEEAGVDSDAEEGDEAGPSTKRRKVNSGRAVAAAKGSKGKAAKAKASGKAAAGKAADRKGKGKWVPEESGSDYDPSSEEEEEDEDEDAASEDEAEEQSAEEAAPSKGKGAAAKGKGIFGDRKRKWGKPINFWAALKGSEGQDAAEKDAQRMVGEAAAERKGRSSKGSEDSVLHQVRWRRIILDEAHCIKDRRCNTARAVFALNSKYKWALSGTPLQNRVAELYSLIRFLRIHPYSKYFCRQCGCSSLDHPFKKSYRQCDICTHSALKHYCWWNRYVANPIKRYGYTGKGRHAMLVLRNEILPRILLRRTKEQCADDLALPPRTLVLRKDRFDEREEDFYEALYTQSQAQFGAYVTSGTLLNNYAHIFDLLIRLRQAVDHPYLVVHSNTGNPTAVPELQREKQQPAGGDDGAGPSTPAASKIKGKGGGKASKAATCEDDGCCVLCHDPREDEVVAGCGHGFCRTCVTEYISSVAKAKCPKCNKALTIDLAAASGSVSPEGPSAAAAAAAPLPSCAAAGRRKGGILSRINRGSFQSSTKIEALREELGRMMERDASAKAIVFSQFTSMLDLICFRLEQVGIKCVRLEGSMTLDARDRAIEAFSHDASVKVFLMSLKAGGVALNLTAASHVMLMDPWWNPAVESQAQDRIHRLGQYKPIHVTRFVIGGTIEERILKLQEKKQAVFEGTVGRDTAALGRLTEDDLKFLFG